MVLCILSSIQVSAFAAKQVKKSNEKKTTYNHIHNHTDSDSICSGCGLCGGRWSRSWLAFWFYDRWRGPGWWRWSQFQGYGHQHGKRQYKICSIGCRRSDHTDHRDQGHQLDRTEKRTEIQRETLNTGGGSMKDPPPFFCTMKKRLRTSRTPISLCTVVSSKHYLISSLVSSPRRLESLMRWPQTLIIVNWQSVHQHICIIIV